MIAQKKRKRKDNTYTLRFDELVTTSRLTAACNNSRYSRTNYALYMLYPHCLQISCPDFHHVVKPYLLP